jgi:hypothetical protein
MRSDRDESHALRGASDGSALRTVRETFEIQEPLVSTGLDDRVDPGALELQFSDGVGEAGSARIDVRWSTANDYNVHYTDSTGVDFRWDRHPHEFPAPSDDAHFHPPPEASADPAAVEPSCIDETRVAVVARAVHKLWRRAYEQDSFADVNTAENPP